MVVVGLLFIGHGVPIVRMELGWTQIMGGSVAASAGCIVLVLGLLLHHLDALRGTMERLVLPAPPLPAQAGSQPVDFGFDSEAVFPERRPVHPLAPAGKRDWALPEEEVRPEPALTAALHPAEPTISEDLGEVIEPDEPPHAEPVLVQSAPALLFAEKEDASHGPAVAPPDPVADPLAETPVTPPRPNFLASFLARRAAGSSLPAGSADPLPLPLPLSFDKGEAPPGARPSIPSRRTSIDLSSGWGEETAEREQPLPPPQDPVDVYTADPEPAGEPAIHPAPDPEPLAAAPPIPDRDTEPDHPPDAVPDPLQPVVVGRYNAGAASYVMYSNGMIEVETEQGTHQFASMQDLKAFIEQRDAKVS